MSSGCEWSVAAACCGGDETARTGLSADPAPASRDAAYNCLDRHFYAHPDKTAIIFEADESGDSREISWGELMRETCRVANVLKEWGVKKGDAVSI
jgi:acyl-coenzyme A synthetase/AMP-(fatty) acid ligase